MDIIERINAELPFHEKCDDDCRLFDVLTDAAREIVQMRSALLGIHQMYSHAWDRDDGGLTMMASSVPRFEDAHRAVRQAIGIKWLEAEDISNVQSNK